MIGAEAKNVLGPIGSVVGVAEWSDVGGLGVGPGRRVNALAADLAVVVVEGFDPLSDDGVPNNALHERLNSLLGLRCRTLARLKGQTLAGDSFEAVTPDVVPGLTSLAPAIGYAIQTIILVAATWAIWGGVATSAYDTNRVAREDVLGKG